MQTLKNNNVKLTVALKESNQHVAEWKEKLQQYKEESAHLQRKVTFQVHECPCVCVCVGRWQSWRQNVVRQ